MREMLSYVYILASKKNGTFYTGVTTDISRRIWGHKEKIIPGFTKECSVTRLVYYECFYDVVDAIKREKRLKKYKRQWKINLIEGKNIFWKDLYEEVCF